MVAPEVVEDRVTTTAELSAGVVVKIGAAVAGKLVGELCAVPPQLALPATTRAAAASALLNWILLKFAIGLISAFALSIVAQSIVAQMARYRLRWKRRMWTAAPQKVSVRVRPSG